MTKIYSKYNLTEELCNRLIGKKCYAVGDRNVIPYVLQMYTLFGEAVLQDIFGEYLYTIEAINMNNTSPFKLENVFQRQDIAFVKEEAFGEKLLQAFRETIECKKTDTNTIVVE